MRINETDWNMKYIITRVIINGYGWTPLWRKLNGSINLLIIIDL